MKGYWKLDKGPAQYCMGATCSVCGYSGMGAHEREFCPKCNADMRKDDGKIAYAPRDDSKESNER